jgi:hypothetical protein
MVREFLIPKIVAFAEEKVIHAKADSLGNKLSPIR